MQCKGCDLMQVSKCYRIATCTFSSCHHMTCAVMQSCIFTHMRATPYAESDCYIDSDIMFRTSFCARWPRYRGAPPTFTSLETLARQRVSEGQRARDKGGMQQMYSTPASRLVTTMPIRGLYFMRCVCVIQHNNYAYNLQQSRYRGLRQHMHARATFKHDSEDRNRGGTKRCRAFRDLPQRDLDFLLLSRCKTLKSPLNHRNPFY